MGQERSPRRSVRLGITIAVVALLAAPVAFDTDGAFPLSTYPMYSSARGTETTFVTAQGITASEARVELTPHLIGGSSDPLIVVGELRAALRAERGDERCQEVADRVARRDDFRDVVAIEVVSERHDNLLRTTGDAASLISRDVRARCVVQQGPAES
ncbi:MAG: hypothetical protein AB8G26_04275 [Ilumatobacter sp.]